MTAAVSTAALEDFERALRKAFPGRLRGIVLYGSHVRGEASEDSDLDVLVLLQGPIELARDLGLCVDAAFPISLEYGVPISALPADLVDYETADYPLYRAARAEGMRR
ncbi:MAG: nucleotidyltransferase domain-containing protein [Candidatus Hydrogenedentes bacterium]|nr:nucleotidyltransferase domain-containing protein [Candidatus Hydrogenedentota bacterium]